MLLVDKQRKMAIVIDEAIPKRTSGKSNTRNLRIKRAERTVPQFS